MSLVGRSRETALIKACISVGRHLLLEGPVGCGKTTLALEVIKKLGRPLYRVDGDARYTEQKLTGWFDPVIITQEGFTERSFIPGPLIAAMRDPAGGILFINEINRLPEGVQNVLLPAIDERIAIVPRLGEVKAAAGFCVIATQNPKEFVGTSHLSEALVDRFEWIQMDYPSEEDERDIIKQIKLNWRHSDAPEEALRRVRLLREDPRVKGGASIRAAQSFALLADELLDQGYKKEEAYSLASELALQNRIRWDLSHEAFQESGGAQKALEARTILQEIAHKKKAKTPPLPSP